MPSTHYYQELSQNSCPAQRVGWRRRIGQAYRFEFVVQVIQQYFKTRPESTNPLQLLDIGAGDGTLYRYLDAQGFSVRPYTPLDNLLSSVSQDTPEFYKAYKLNSLSLPAAPTPDTPYTEQASKTQLTTEQASITSTNQLKENHVTPCIIEYLGLDPYPHVKDPTVPSHALYPVAYQQFTPQKPFDIAIAIGTLTQSNALSTDTSSQSQRLQTKKNFLDLVHYLHQTAHTFILIAVDHHAYQATEIVPDPAITGLELNWLQDLHINHRSLTPLTITRQEVLITDSKIAQNLDTNTAFWGAVRQGLENTPLEKRRLLEGAWLSYQMGNNLRAKTLIKTLYTELTDMDHILIERLYS